LTSTISKFDDYNEKVRNEELFFVNRKKNRKRQFILKRARKKKYIYLYKTKSTERYIWSPTKERNALINSLPFGGGDTSYDW